MKKELVLGAASVLAVWKRMFRTKPQVRIHLLVNGFGESRCAIRIQVSNFARIAKQKSIKLIVFTENSTISSTRELGGGPFPSIQGRILCKQGSEMFEDISTTFCNWNERAMSRDQCSF